MLPEKNFTYGKQNKPSTPVGAVMAFAYGEAAGIEHRRRYEANYLERKQSNPDILPGCRMTQCQKGMNEAIQKKYLEQPVQQSAFKLRRFTENIGPKVSTKRMSLSP